MNSGEDIPIQEKVVSNGFAESILATSPDRKMSLRENDNLHGVESSSDSEHDGELQGENGQWIETEDMFPKRSHDSIAQDCNEDSVSNKKDMTKDANTDLEARAAEVINEGFPTDPIFSELTKKDGDSGFISPDVAPTQIAAQQFCHSGLSFHPLTARLQHEPPCVQAAGSEIQRCK